MANNPTSVALLDQSGKVILNVTGSHPESLNNKGSENTRSIKIDGPANSVVTCFDDQQFRMGQNSLQITKTVADTVVVPIAQNFVEGQQRNGVFFGSTATYKWQFRKAIAEVVEHPHQLRLGRSEILPRRKQRVPIPEHERWR